MTAKLLYNFLTAFFSLNRVIAKTRKVRSRITRDACIVSGGDSNGIILHKKCDFRNFVSLFPTGEMCSELHGEVPENEPAYFTEVSRIPDFSKRKCDGVSPEIRCHSSMIQAAVDFSFCPTPTAGDCC